MTMTIKVLKSDKVIKEFTNQKNDFVGFKYLLRHQSQSISYAVKHEGWNVIGICEQTGNELINYKTDK